MADSQGVVIKQRAASMLARTVLADVKTEALLPIYTCPPGKKLIVDRVVFHSPTATLDGMNDVNLGGGAAGGAPVWLDNVTTIEGLTTTAHYMVLRADATALILIDGDDSTVANRTFNADLVAGSTGVAGVTVDLYGFLIDARPPA